MDSLFLTMDLFIMDTFINSLFMVTENLNFHKVTYFQVIGHLTLSLESGLLSILKVKFTKGILWTFINKDKESLYL